MKIGRFRSLAFKLTIWYIVILGLIIAFSGTFLYEGFKKRLMADTDEELGEIAEGVNTAWRPRGVTWEEALRKAEEEFKAHDPYLQAVKLVENGGGAVERIYRTGKIPPGAFTFGPDVYSRAEQRDWDHLLYLTATDKKLAPSPLRVVFMPIRGETIIQAGISMERVSGDLNQLMIIMILSGLLLLLFASLGGSFIIRRALRPVTSVVQTAKDITADDLSLRIEAKNQKDEIGALVATFNDMIARLEKSVGKIRQFSGDVSHELRTPLTIIRGEIEVVLRKARSAEEYHETLESVLDETHHMEKIIDDLLFLSRLEATDKIEFSDDVEPNEILSRVWNSRGPAAREKGIEFKIPPSSPSRIRGERTLLERLLTNLVDNAVRYTPAGGNVVVGVEERDQWLVLTVRDTGIGIPEESLPHIFDRFYVVDSSRSKESGGSGLGLSIVKSVADIHGAAIEVRSRVGEGTTFAIKFPLKEQRA